MESLCTTGSLPSRLSMAARAVLMPAAASPGGRLRAGRANRPAAGWHVVGGREHGGQGRARPFRPHGGRARADQPGPARLPRRRSVRDARVTSGRWLRGRLAAQREMRRAGPHPAEAQLLLVRADVHRPGPAAAGHAGGRQGPVRHRRLAQRPKRSASTWAASPPARFDVTGAIRTGTARTGCWIRIGAHPAALPDWAFWGTDGEKAVWTPGIYDSVSLVAGRQPGDRKRCRWPRGSATARSSSRRG